MSCQHCPHCQRLSRFSRYRQGDLSDTSGMPRVRAYQSAIALPAPEPQITKYAPVRAMNLESDVFVPLLSSVVTGGLFAFSGTVFAGEVLGLGPTQGLRAGLFACSGIMPLMWMFQLALSSRNLATVEHAPPTSSFANDKATFANDEESFANEEPTTVRLEIIQNRGSGYQRMMIVDLPASYSQLREIAEGVLAGKPFSEREWKDVITPAKFRELRDEMIERGLLAWKVQGSPKQGVVLTEDGEGVFERLASPAPA